MKKYLLFSLLLINAFQVKAQLSTNALYFDGTGDLVRIPNIPAYDFGFNPFTVEAWVRDDDPAGTMFTNLPILSNRTGFQDPDGFLLTILEGYLTVIHGSGAGISIGAVDFRDNICHHVALTRPTPFSIQCYIDGIYVGSGTLDTVSFTSDLFIGSSPDFNGGPWGFHGLIKEVRLWNTARTQSQVQANMNIVLSGAANPNLVGYWRCNDVASQTITDYSTHQNPGTLGLNSNVESIDPTPAAGCPSCMLPSGSITAGGALTFCSGSNVTLTATTGAGLAYLWKKDGTPIPGATQSVYTANASGNYLCIITNSCGSIASNVLTVTVQTVPSNTISTSPNSTVVCTGGYVYLYSSATTGSLFQWKLNGTNIAGATHNYYQATVIGNYTCTASNACGNTISNTITVTTGTPPTASIAAAGTTTFCNGKSVVLNANTGTNYTYNWLRDGIYVSGYSASYTATQTGNYQAKVSIAYSGCSTTSNSIQVTVTPSTTPANLTPSGTIVNCGSNVIFNANAGTGLTYVWHNYQYYIPGATSSTYTATSNGSYSVSITNSSGCVSVSDTTVVTLTLPTQLGIFGNASSCAGNLVHLSVIAGLGLNNYQWKLNGVNIAGATLAGYDAAVTGSYTYVATNACGSDTPSAKAVTFNPLPSAIITPAGPTTFCSGGSVVLNAPVAANRTYQWKKGANLISGATLSSYAVITGGNYKVIVTNTVTGCSKTTASETVVTVNGLPTATITPQGPTTFCAGGSVILQANTGTGFTYKWKKNNVYISGATQSSYTATTAGIYKTEVTKSNGCSKTSAIITVTVPCREGETILAATMFDVTVFPNPSSGDFTFEFENVSEEKISIHVYDIMGKLVLSESIHNSAFIIHNSKLTPGVYSAMITNGETKKIVKLVKTN